jgi:hypothetical protein
LDISQRDGESHVMLTKIPGTLSEINDGRKDDSV